MTSRIYTLHKTSAYPLGAYKTDKGVRFSFETGTFIKCGVLLYPAGMSAPIKIEFPSWTKEGRICAAEVRFAGTNIESYLSDSEGRGLRYLFFTDDEIFPDPYMQDSDGFGSFGQVTSPFSRLSTDKYVNEEVFAGTHYSDSLLYMVHVRGYTAHSSSGVKDRGTFRGLIRKLPYIQSLGVTGLILMPVYEFNEIIYAPDIIKKEDDKPVRVNYWGYAGGYYYVPKHAYSASGNPVAEMHEMIDAIHKAGIEVILQFMFKADMTVREITDILRFWRDRYHVDGFQLIGTGLPINDILSDPILYGCKILYDEAISMSGDKINPEHGYLDSGYMTDIRKFLKGDPNSALNASMQFKNADPSTHPIVYIARQDTMRAVDIVSYNEKHNEDNGENGRDGIDYNYSWNCGFEGITRKKSIVELRRKQLKNAFAMLLTSQGTPLIYGGDEFGNTQFGNNNPYNQDNATGYIKWTKSAFGTDILDFVKNLIKIRRSHPSIGADHSFTGRDYLSYGYPDVSMHGEELWRADIGPTSHDFGILYYDRYSDADDKRLIYLIYNMHWETKNIALPKLKGGSRWVIAATTDELNSLENIEDAKESLHISIRARSIIILENQGTVNDRKK